MLCGLHSLCLLFSFFRGVALRSALLFSHKQATKKSDTYFSSQHQRSRLIRGDKFITESTDSIGPSLSLSFSHTHTHTLSLSLFIFPSAHDAHAIASSSSARDEKRERGRVRVRENITLFLYSFFFSRRGSIKLEKGKG